MLLLIILLPLFGFFSGSLFGFNLSKGICYITTFSILCSFICCIILIRDIICYNSIYTLKLTSWLDSGFLSIDCLFYFDSLTAVMLVIVTGISALVHLYSIEYMKFDPHLIRFMSYISLFTFFMIILITSGNFLQMFIGWEGVGLSSYLLINFWFTRIQANKSAIKAMLVNRIGDFFILLALFLLYYSCNSLDYVTIFTISVSKINTLLISFIGVEIFTLDIICICLFFGAMAKSAQFGLHTWLPDAMEAPTPVSALIHAATMVTAGVFLITRSSFLFEYSPVILNLIMFIGSVTCFFASSIGLFQNDIKKVIAYSTCSQLGYMIFACGLSSYEIGIFHLSNHAFFKALLFLGAGSIIHALSDEQDMRKMGALRSLLPYSYAIMLIGSLALAGFPFLAGFYSKDTILEIAYSKYTTLGHLCYLLGTISAFFTAFYSTRLLFLVFLSEPNGNKLDILNAYEPSTLMAFPLFFLSILSILIGFMSKELFLGFGNDFWNNSVYVLPKNYLLVDVEFINLFYKQLPLIFTVLGSLSAYFIYALEIQNYYIIKKSHLFKIFYTFLNKKWYFDKIYNEAITQSILYYSYQFSYKEIDRGIVEYIGPSGIVNRIKILSNILKIYQTGNIYHYLLLFFISILIIILFSFIFL